MTYHLYNANFLNGEGELESISTHENNNEETANFVSSFSLKVLLNNLATDNHSYNLEQLQSMFFRTIDSLSESIEISKNKTILLYHHNHYQIFEYGDSKLYQKLYELAHIILEKFREHQLALFYSQSLNNSVGVTSLIYLLKHRHNLNSNNARRVAHQILFFQKNGINSDLAYQQESMAFTNFVNNMGNDIA